MSNSDFYNTLKQALSNVRIPHPQSGQSLTLTNYLAVPPEVRADDEQDVVDRLLTLKILECLGYESKDLQYNRDKAVGRPDFVIRPLGKTAFFWEDKRTSLELDPESDQIRRYAESIAQVGVLFNGKEIVAFRREQEALSAFIQVNLLEAFEEFGGPVLEFVREEAKEKLELFYELFKKERFTAFDQRLQALQVTEEAWKSQARSIKDYLHTFIDEIQAVIDRLAHMAHSALEFSDKKIMEYEHKLQNLQEKWQEYLKNSTNRLAPGRDAQAFLSTGQSLAVKLGDVNDDDLQS